jgi:hypothetical protein
MERWNAFSLQVVKLDGKVLLEDGDEKIMIRCITASLFRGQKMDGI